MVVDSNGNTRVANGRDETSTQVVKETAKTQASPARAQLNLLPSNIGDIYTSALSKTATDVKGNNA